jgi:hypothetical protein
VQLWTMVGALVDMTETPSSVCQRSPLLVQVWVKSWRGSELYHCAPALKQDSPLFCQVMLPIDSRKNGIHINKLSSLH